MTTTFTRGNMYSRNDIYKILNVPKERQGGHWNTGYRRYNDDLFIFANIKTAGTTGHNYDNYFIGDDLNWYGRKDHHPKSSSLIHSMLNPNGNIYIFTRENNKNPKFVYHGNARVKKYFETVPVHIVWEFNDETENHSEKLAEEITEPERYNEGSTKTISVNVYERNSIARRKCIEYYGVSCVVCGFNFEERYGQMGKDFIHVHHLKELSQIGEEYEINPIEDLRPVCPNCHSMLHKRKPAYSIEELKNLL
ncbi:DUF3427 domain-containing protein [Bacillus mycoides]|uniref:DUF3427 domain-containing protein n=1 Tax=Bacillus mycoides TaxID=1405 RepID=UPI000B4A9897|nr:DUF3427 domain-containing protein [Bacillus mycoides]